MAISEQEIRNARILIVDDREANTGLLTQLLSNAGFTLIQSTTNPDEVCDLYRENNYDLVLLDLQMPTMDGFAVMECMKKNLNESYLPVMAVSAQPAHKVRALQCGAKDFITTPFDVPEMLIRVHNMLEIRLSHKAARNQGKLLESLALKDPLTGLANRRLLADLMSVALVHARRNKSAMAVMYLDLDGFKQVNDTLGHAGGDALLKMVAGRLQATVREADTVARLGGDEFVIALWDVPDREDVAGVAKKMIQAVSQPYRIEGTDINITTSVGVSIYPEHGTDEEQLMKMADRALYGAKRSGKNAYQIAENSVAGLA